jgi:L-ascorbate metabolism protein UlaG (beta-lactamase superfamily)
MDTCLSYVLKNSQTVYFAGDTDLFPEMDSVGSDFDLDIALLPVWGYGPWIGAGHLTPLTAAKALARLQPRVAVPIHWGSFRYIGPHSLWKRAGFMRQPPHTFADHALQLAPQTEVRVLQPGQSTAVR